MLCYLSISITVQRNDGEYLHINKYENWVKWNKVFPDDGGHGIDLLSGDFCTDVETRYREIVAEDQ